eukprot:347149-Prorocentrum_minimum.AAC.1
MRGFALDVSGECSATIRSGPMHARDTVSWRFPFALFSIPSSFVPSFAPSFASSCPSASAGSAPAPPLPTPSKPPQDPLLDPLPDPSAALPEGPASASSLPSFAFAGNLLSP